MTDLSPHQLPPVRLARLLFLEFEVKLESRRASWLILLHTRIKARQKWHADIGQSVEMGEGGSVLQDADGRTIS